MAWSGLNFRSTSGYVTDGTGETYVLAATSYPTTRGGLTFGYVSTIGNQDRDRSSSIDRRIAGMHFGAAAGRTFRFDLPGGAGTYRVRVLFGDNDAGWSHQCVIKDGAGGSTLATITGTTSTARWLDADGTTSITAANVASDAFGDVELTFTASLAEFVFGNGSSSPHSTIAHIAVEEVAATGYTLTCAQGSYTLTGQAAGTKVGRKLAAGQGTYTLTGSAASLLEGHVITCAQGSYTLTGSTAYADYAITCASGSYTLSGQAAGTKAARKLAAAQGSYTLTGQDVALLYTTPGAYSLAMGQGTYALTGQAAALQAARRIVAEQGLYALSGQAAALRLGRKVALAVGSYSLTGQDIAFDAPARLAAAAGSYALTGQAVTLTYAGAPVAAVLSAPPSGRRLQGYGRPANIQRSTR